MVSEAKAMNNMEGKDEKGDVRVETMASAMEALAGMIPAGDSRFDYASLHLGKGVCKDCTKEHVHRAFLLWSQKPADRENDSFNVSKAFRRLTAFADYTTDMFDKYLQNRSTWTRQTSWRRLSSWNPHSTGDRPRHRSRRLDHGLSTWDEQVQ